ncbi:MAG TPA: hypothetical protein H9987_11865 [Candidatus Luteococcus avicola]|nr:hypothetical protein [Candidatus Luteococcus avicola]
MSFTSGINETSEDMLDQLTEDLELAVAATKGPTRCISRLCGGALASQAIEVSREPEGEPLHRQIEFIFVLAKARLLRRPIEERVVDFPEVGGDRRRRDCH